MALHGRAFQVIYPRRPEQNYVTTDVDQVVKDVHMAIRDLGWKIQVSVINFVGESALQVLTNASDVLDKLDPSIVNRLSLPLRAHGREIHFNG